MSYDDYKRLNIAIMNKELLISEILASAVSPVFLLAGVGALLNVMTGRLGRIVDRLRHLQGYIDKANAEDKKTFLLNLKQSVFRMLSLIHI